MEMLQAIGGLGLFLLGMIVMTEGLKGLAGDAIRRALMRFTRSPLSGAMTGALSTAILQSSSATTVAAVGFVGAGLLSFSNALGIVFGANIGTTITGWMVVLLGFKLKLGLIVMPLILVGAIMRLFTRGRLALSGYAMAGFGLIFVGISLMQEGMAGLQGVLTPADFPSGSWLAYLALVGMGVVATVITQSSSAGVAATLTALYAGVLHFDQAAALVIGMDVGTTVTAMLATIGGSVGARRTGFSHFLYNLFGATCALLLLTPYIWLWENLAGDMFVKHPGIALVAFHTSFNTFGVLVVLLFVGRFASLVERIIPDPLGSVARELDRSLLTQPVLAIAAAQHVIRAEFVAIVKAVNFLLGDKRCSSMTDLVQARGDLDRLSEFTDDIELEKQQGTGWESLITLNHALDHLRRLHERCEEDVSRAKTAREAEELRDVRQMVIESNRVVINELEDERLLDLSYKLINVYEKLRHKEPEYRAAVMERIARGEIDAIEGRAHLEAIRWLKRVSHHIARITEYLNKFVLIAGKESK